MPAKKPVKRKKDGSVQKRLRDITWEIGQTRPVHPDTDHIALLMVHPHYGHVYWHIMDKSLGALRKQLRKQSETLTMIIRVYDVTDIMFDGSNAHTFFDMEANEGSGRHYFKIDRSARNYIAEAGVRCGNGAFHSLARSNAAFFEHDGPAGDYRTDGLFVGGALNRTFPVKNIFDAPVFESLNRVMSGTKRKAPLSAANIFLDITPDEGRGNPILSLIMNVCRMFEIFGGNAHVFTEQLKKTAGKSFKTLLEAINISSETIYKQLSSEHKKKPFHLIHCHDWYSSKVGLTASAKLKLPMALTLHSTEAERSSGNPAGQISSRISKMEKEAVLGASLVIVPLSSTYQNVISLYGADPEKVVIINTRVDDRPADAHPDSTEAIHRLGLNQDDPVVLFAGEISHASGADIMVDALHTVCRNHGKAQFVFAGDGPLKNELEARVRHMGLGQRCRFTGHLASRNFESLLLASDFVVIPARTWQDEGVARMATSAGRPVVTTRQSGITCINHGENGLVTFDNPGSIVWGIQEMLSNPIKGSMLRIAARKHAGESLSFDTIAARHYMHYELLLKNNKAVKNA